MRDADFLEDDRLAVADSWNSRARVDQATGMVMGQLGIGPDDGLALLRAHAYAHGRTLGEISDQIIARRLDFRSADRDPGSEG